MNGFNKIVPCILSGGSGSRLWPLSRKSMPKQFLNLTGSNSLIQQTATRARDSGFRAPLVISGQDHRFIVAEQLRSIGIEDARIILEPVGRNTAPAAAVASLLVMEEDPDGLILLLPSDHAILDAAAFRQAVGVAQPAAANGLLVAFGVTPLSPETGYGYIKAGDELASTVGVRDIEMFVEKPSRENAERFLLSGNFFWNSGIYLFQAKAFIREMAEHQPEMLTFCRRALDGAKRDLNFVELDEAAFLACPSDSIDYAITEKTDNSAVVPVDMRWSDVGSWNSLWEFLPHSEEGNVVRGDVVLSDTKNSYIHSEFPLVTASGIEDLVIVATKDAVFVSRRDGTQGVKNILETLARQERCQAIEHLLAHRPWGTCDDLASGPQFQVQQVVVKPGEKLPLQLHHKRAEHWTVVEGSALVTRGEDHFILRHNESAFIPNGVLHSLENSSSSPLRMIIVLCGSYLGEDDNVGFEDTSQAAVD